jgi:rhomboid protease GluP
MAINIIIFVLPLLVGVNVMDMSAEYLYSIGAMFGPSVVMEGEVWRLFLAMFLHGGVEHVLMNMLSLFLVGRSVEMIFSTRSYLSIYFISGVIGSLVSIYFHPVSVGIGASGAIFGIFGAVVGFALVHHKQMHDEFQSFIKSVGVILLLNLVIGLVFPNVDMSAHIGGAIAGIVGGAIIAKNPKNLWLYIILSLIVMAGIYGYLPTLFVDTNEVLYRQ